MTRDIFYGLDEVCYPAYSLVVVGGIKEYCLNNSINPKNVLEHEGIIIARYGKDLRPTRQMYHDCINFLRIFNSNVRIYACGSGSYVFSDVVTGKSLSIGFRESHAMNDKSREKALELEQGKFRMLRGHGELWMGTFLRREFNINGNGGGTETKGGQLLELFSAPTIIDKEWWDRNERKNNESPGKGD